MNVPRARSSAALNCVGPVSVCLDGPRSDVAVVTVYDSAGRRLLEARASVDVLEPALLVRALQRPIGFN